MQGADCEAAHLSAMHGVPSVCWSCTPDLTLLLPLPLVHGVRACPPPAGLVFTPLTQPYLHEFGEDWSNSCPRRLYDKAMHSIIQKPGQQVVILSQVGCRQAGAARTA